MRSTLVLLTATLVLPALLPAAARAADVTLPSGFNLESQPGPGPTAAVLPDGKVLVATGSFGSDELSLRQPDGSLTLFATGFGSIAGIAQSPVTGVIVVGDSFFSPALRVLADLNADEDALDAGENVAHPVALPVLSNGAAPLPFALVFRPSTDELFVSGSTSFMVSPTLGVVVRIAAGTAAVFAEDLGFAAGMVWSGDTLYTGDVNTSSFAGRVVALTDGNDDDDALDAGEAVDFASGLSGASDLVQAQDGSFYLSGGTGPGFVGTVARLSPDDDDDGVSDFVDPLYFSGFGFSANLTLSEGAGGLQPGVEGDGTLLVQDFSFSGDLAIRTAPLATLALDGTVQNNASFEIVVGGEAGAGAVAVLSLDQVGVTLYGTGDLGLGFGAPFFIVPLAPIGGSGSSSLTVVLHGVDDAVGLSFTVQGFTLQHGEIGISNAIDAVVAP